MEKFMDTDMFGIYEEFYDAGGNIYEKLTINNKERKWIDVGALRVPTEVKVVNDVLTISNIKSKIISINTFELLGNDFTLKDVGYLMGNHKAVTVIRAYINKEKYPAHEYYCKGDEYRLNENPELKPLPVEEIFANNIKVANVYNMIDITDYLGFKLSQVFLASNMEGQLCYYKMKEVFENGKVL